jgi:hypothetical protein
MIAALRRPRVSPAKGQKTTGPFFWGRKKQKVQYVGQYLQTLNGIQWDL